MKKTLIGILFLGLSLTSLANTEVDSESTYFHLSGFILPIPILMTTGNVNLEFALAERTTLAASIGGLTATHGTFNYLTLGARARYFFSGAPSAYQGWYLGGSIGGGTGIGVIAASSAIAFTTLNIGHRWELDSGFTFGLGGGLGFISSLESGLGVSGSTLYPDLDIRFGYRF